MAKIDELFKIMNDQGASDLHLVAGSQPIIRVHGDMERVDYKSLENDKLKKMLYEIAPENKIKLKCQIINKRKHLLVLLIYYENDIQL